MHPELENLVNNLLTNGELTERSRELLMKKAAQLGVDDLDFELELEARIAKTKTTHPPTPVTSNKEGSVKKCPSCGAVAESFSTKCKDCGHEYRDSNSATSVKQLHISLQKAYDDELNKPRNVSVIDKWLGGNTTPQGLERAVANKQISLLSSFPVPNNKEDILEFLSMALPEATKKVGFWGNQSSTVDGWKGDLKKAWKAKAEQVIMKARFSMKDDKKTLEEIEHYAKQLGI